MNLGNALVARADARARARRDAGGGGGGGDDPAGATADLDAAVAAYIAANERAPRLAVVYYNLAVALERRGGGAAPARRAAIEAYRTGLRLDPSDAAGWCNLGAALLRSAGSSDGEGEQRWARCNEAITAFREAARLAPRDADAHYNLGVALQRAGRDAEAVAPLLIDARTPLEWLLVTCNS